MKNLTKCQSGTGPTHGLSHTVHASTTAIVYRLQPTVDTPILNVCKMLLPDFSVVHLLCTLACATSSEVAPLAASVKLHSVQTVYANTVKNSSITTKHLYLILAFRCHHEIFIRRSWYSVLRVLMRRSAVTSRQEAQLSLRDRATRACQLKSGKVLHKCRRLVFEKL